MELGNFTKSLQILVKFLLSLPYNNDIVHKSICFAEIMLSDEVVSGSLKAE